MWDSAEKRRRHAMPCEEGGPRHCERQTSAICSQRRPPTERARDFSSYKKNARWSLRRASAAAGLFCRFLSLFSSTLLADITVDPALYGPKPEFAFGRAGEINLFLPKPYHALTDTTYHGCRVFTDNGLSTNHVTKQVYVGPCDEQITFRDLTVNGNYRFKLALIDGHGADVVYSQIATFPAAGLPDYGTQVAGVVALAGDSTDEDSAVRRAPDADKLADQYFKVTQFGTRDVDVHLETTAGGWRRRAQIIIHPLFY